MKINITLIIGAMALAVGSPNVSAGTLTLTPGEKVSASKGSTCKTNQFETVIDPVTQKEVGHWSVITSEAKDYNFGRINIKIDAQVTPASTVVLKGRFRVAKGAIFTVCLVTADNEKIWQDFKEPPAANSPIEIRLDQCGWSTYPNSKAPPNASASVQEIDLMIAGGVSDQETESECWLESIELHS